MKIQSSISLCLLFKMKLTTVTFGLNEGDRSLNVGVLLEKLTSTYRLSTFAYK